MGLLWTGPNWAGEAFCVTHGRMVRALAEARADGVAETAVRAALLTPQTSEAIRILLEANIRLVYASAEAPAALAAKAEAVCRTVTPPPSPSPTPEQR